MIVVIPFRDRGTDPLRRQNLDRVLEHWRTFDAPVHVVDDGGSGQFNRSAAYNRAPQADVIVYTESDMLIPHHQIRQGIALAAAKPGLVVPFTQYRYLSPEDSVRVRAHDAHPADCTPESVMDNGASIGAINIVSKQSLDLVGQWDETFKGSWFDDRAMCRAFEMCCQPTRYITGPAWHLYHLPGWKGEHLSDEDKAATARNKARWKLYKQARTPERIRQLTRGGS